MHAIPLVVMHLRDRRVDGDFVEIRAAQARDLGIDVRVNATSNGSLLKSSPGTMCAVQNATCSVSAKKLSGLRLSTMRPIGVSGTSSSGMSLVASSTSKLYFSVSSSVNTCTAKLPLGIRTGLDRFPEVAAVKVGIGAGDFDSLVPHERVRGEELIGAAYASCFSMALALMLGEAGLTPERIEARADVTLEKTGAILKITAIHLTVSARVPGTDNAKFQHIANMAKTGCPVSLRLKAQITMDAKFED